MSNELCSVCKKSPSTHYLITGERTCIECDIALCCVDYNRFKYEGFKGIKADRWVKTFITPEEIERYDNDPKYSVTYSEQWPEPDRYMKGVGIGDTVYIENLTTGKYFAAYLPTPCK